LDATEIGGNYYTLTYAPSNGDYDGKLRKIHVGLSTKGYQLSYRRSYYADDPDLGPHRTRKKEVAEQQQSASRKIGDSLSANMQHGAPMAHQIYFRAHIRPIGVPALATPEQMANLADQPAYFRVRRKNRPSKPLPAVQLQTYEVDYVLATRPGTSHNAKPPAVEVAAAAFDEEGQMLNGLVETSAPASAQSAGGSNSNGIYRVEQQIEVPLTATSMRIAVRDVTTDRIGTMEVPLPLAPELTSVSNPPASPRKPPDSTKSH
jgi:hypothetical protein